jgi:hypothetical protein
MSSKVKCTCGHSWDKKDSSKKDMYVCHECGKDNTMKDGGWLSKYDDGGPMQENYNDADAFYSEDYVGAGYDIIGRNYSPAWGGQFEHGGTVPGSVGFTYARTKGIPSNGPYAKKTKASAQNGKEMQFYQNGLDWKPKSISRDGSVIEDDRGQWDHPGEVTKINSNEITMQGVDYPVLGISDTGDTQMMQPGEDYTYDGNSVTEYPMMEDGGWLSKYDAPKAQTGLDFKALMNPGITQSSTKVAMPKDQPKAAIQLNKYKSQQATKEKERLKKLDLAKKGQSDLSNLAADIGTTALTLPTQFRTPTEEELEAGRSGNWSERAPIMSDAVAWGLGNELLGGAMGYAAKNAGPFLNVAKKAIGTEEGLLSNAYKLNPWAERLNNVNKSYRVAGLDALEDFQKTGILTSKNTAPSTLIEGTDFMLPPRPTSFPSFQKGYADLNYLPKEGGAIFETALPTFKRGEINPVTGFPIKGRHYAHRVIDPKTGNALGGIPASDIRAFGDKPHWLQGYKEVPKPASNIENIYPSFKQITNNPENIDSEHLAGLIKRESDWLRSPEYIKRKMTATGRSEASIKKESENIINNINNTSIEYTGTYEDGASGLYSSGTGRNPKISVFDGVPMYPYSSHPFYTGVLDHEVKHAFSESAFVSDKLTDLIKNTGYNNYPKANLNKTIKDKINSAFDMNWSNLAQEQQVTGRRMMDLVENTQGVKRGTQLTDSNIEDLIQSLKSNKYDNADIYHVATQFKRKFGENYKTQLKDFLNKAWIGVPGVIGAGAATSQMSNAKEQKNGGWLDKYQIGGIVPKTTAPIVPSPNVNKELTFEQIPTTDNKKIVINNFSPSYDYVLEGDKTYYKTKAGKTWADISDNKQARENLVKFIDKNNYWAGYGSGENKEVKPIQPNENVLKGKGDVKYKPTVKSTTPLKKESSVFDDVSNYIGSEIDSLGNKSKKLTSDLKNELSNTITEVKNSVASGTSNAIQSLEDVYQIGINGIKRKYATHTGNDDDVAVPINTKPKSVSEYYGDNTPAQISAVIDAPKGNGRQFKQQVVPTSAIQFGVRNRGEYKDIETDGLEVTTFHPFTKDPHPDNTSVLAIDSKGTLHTGSYKDFKGKPGYLFSKTFKNKIVSFPEKNGKSELISGEKSGNPNYKQPAVQVLDDKGKLVNGSMNILVKDQTKKDYYGSIEGGRVLFVNPTTKEQYLVSGSMNHIKEEFKKIKGNEKYLEAYTLDNGTYSRGLSYKDKKLTPERLKSYDLENTSGGNGLYIKNYSKPINKFQEEYVENMPNIRTEKDESYKKGHPLKNKISNVVLHHTAYENPKTSEQEVREQYMTPGQNSSHVVIQENGKRDVYASPEQVTFHAGESSWNNKKDVNDFSIGVEFQGNTSKKPLTQAQIESFVEYYAPIAKKYNLSLKDIVTHEMVAPGRKGDVSKKEYARIIKYMKDNKYK